MFAVTPPLDTIKMILLGAATMGDNWKTTILIVSDVRGAYIYAAATVPIYFEMPLEDMSEEDRLNDMIVVLNMAMHGASEAASKLQTIVATTCFDH